MIDIAIIGAGPAGLSAAITGAIRNRKVTVFGNHISTSFIYKADKVNNYLGLKGVSGKEMMENFEKHAKDLGVDIQYGKVIDIFPMGTHYTLNVENNFIEAKTVILANGLSKTKVLEGEQELLGRGVSYCATCDGMLYRGKDVIVVADSSHAEEEAEFLAEICNKVTYIPLYKEINKLSDKIEVVKVRPTKILGENAVSGIEYDGGKIEASGVFLLNDNVPTTKLLNGIELDGTSIKVNRYMETNLPGVFAAGDCTGKPYQVAKAVGEGSTAVLQAINYLYERGCRTS